MLHTSKESSEKQLRLGREQGKAQSRAMQAMREETGHAEQIRAGDYLVSYAIEEAEGLYLWRHGSLEWHDPTDENAHIEIVVCDAEDGRFIPGLDITLNIRSGRGEDFGTHKQPLLWHPWLLHYGRNWTLPGDGDYELHVHIDPLQMPRHDKVNGGRFDKPVDVVFGGVAIETGQKKG